MGQPEGRTAADADLVREALLGDREPFAELVRRHQGVATALAARVLGSQDLARDAVQEATVAAMTGLDRLRSADRFGPWFCGIALNVARRWLRQLRAERPEADGLDRARPGAGPDELAELADLAARVRAAIASLAGGQRDAVFLFYLQGLSHREVAAELGVSVGAVKARLHQARAALAPQLAPLIDTPLIDTPLIGSAHIGTAHIDTAHIDTAHIDTVEAGTVPASTDAPEWIDVSVAEVLRDERVPDQRKHIIVLEAAGGQGTLPIWVGPAEATALALTLQAAETPRPLTYQLAASLLQASGSRITEARITRLDGGTFYAVLVVDGPHGRQEVDARPSDAVALAAVVSAPVRADSRVFAENSMARLPELPDSFTRTAELAAEHQERMARLYADPQRSAWPESAPPPASSPADSPPGD